MGVEVVHDPLPEYFFADVGLEHAQHARALPVGDRGVVDVPGRFGRITGRSDRRRAGEAIARESLRRPAGAEVIPGLLRGIDAVDGGVADERGEALVEPDIVPPLHRDEVAEPLMREFVGDRNEDKAPVKLSGPLVDQELPLLERDRAPVLHGPPRQFADSDEVELGQGVGDLVVSLVGPEEGSRDSQGEPARAGATGARHYGDRGGPGAIRDPFEFPDAQIEQVRGHGRGSGEGPATAASLPFHRGRYGIRNHLLLGVDAHRQGKSSLAIGPVDARENPACTRCGALARQYMALPRMAPVEADHRLGLDGAAEPNMDLRVRAAPAQGHPDLLGRRIECRSHELPIDEHLIELESHRVQFEHRGGGPYLELIRSGPRSGRKVDVEGQSVLLDVGNFG